MFGDELVRMVYGLTHTAILAQFASVIEVRAQAWRVHRALSDCASSNDRVALRSSLLTNALTGVNVLDAKIVSLADAHPLDTVPALRVDRLRWSITKCLLRAMRGMTVGKLDRRGNGA
jgi:hypothetical protein